MIKYIVATTMLKLKNTVGTTAITPATTAINKLIRTFMFCFTAACSLSQTNLGLRRSAMIPVIDENKIPFTDTIKEHIRMLSGTFKNANKAKINTMAIPDIQTPLIILYQICFSMGIGKYFIMNKLDPSRDIEVEVTALVAATNRTNANIAAITTPPYSAAALPMSLSNDMDSSCMTKGITIKTGIRKLDNIQLRK